MWQLRISVRSCKFLFTKLYIMCKMSASTWDAYLKHCINIFMYIRLCLWNGAPVLIKMMCTVHSMQFRRPGWLEQSQQMKNWTGFRNAQQSLGKQRILFNDLICSTWILQTCWLLSHKKINVYLFRETRLWNNVTIILKPPLDFDIIYLCEKMEIMPHQCRRLKQRYL